ncbi:hypothetical protein ACFLTX_01770 [Chloroflexota bacterium]
MIFETTGIFVEVMFNWEFGVSGFFKPIPYSSIKGIILLLFLGLAIFISDLEDGFRPDPCFE